MLKKYITSLPNGQETQKVSLLNRMIILRDGEIVSESLITQTFPRFFRVLKDTDISQKIEETQEVQEVQEFQETEFLLDNSSDVKVDFTEPQDLPLQDVETIQAQTDEKPKTRTRKSK